MTTTTQKAVRATIVLGDIEIDVFQMPDRSYCYSQTQAFMSIADKGYDTKQAAKRYIEKITSKQAKTLIPQGFSSIVKVKIEGENQTFNAISQTDVTNFWLLFAVDSNMKAIALLGACAQEALERRADAAFNILRTEEERNQFFIERRDGKKARREYTDMIKKQIDAGYELNYGWLTLRLYKCIGITEAYYAWKNNPEMQLVATLSKTGFRDTLQADELRIIKEAELAVVWAVEDYSLPLKEAFDKVEQRYTRQLASR